MLIALLVVLLLISLAANGLLWWRWHSYRGKPAGSHSWTGMMPAVKVYKQTRD